ncbi:PHP domain-containing protein [Balneola sp. MJW-20]|uniref:PHP domain-containing protein n=1 Tax=Gracilimonas aurantiaca TaxID=3234185 RepID=UPI0034655887
MAQKADLHIHTKHSDGRLTPAEAVEWAVEKNLSVISITDHDTYEGYFEAKEMADEAGIACIPGVEITTNFRSRECHLLAYNFETDTNYLADFLNKQKRARKDRIKGIIATLKSKGVEVDYDEVWAEANGANMGRPHLARVMVDKGYAGNVNEAFIRYLSDKQLGNIDNSYPDYKKVIEIVKNVGGAILVAHPGRMYNENEVEEFIASGIDGLECIHPSHNWETQKKFTEICEKNSLLMTGGSDCHDSMGSGYSHFGVVTIATKHVDKMLRMTEQRKKIVDIKN